MSYLYQHSGKNISLAAGSCLTAPIICGSTCVQSAQILSTKVSVGSLNTSYDLYNNGTTYLNGSVTIDNSAIAHKFKSNQRLWNTQLLCCNNFFADSGASGGDGFALGQGTGILDIWVKDDSVSELRSVFRANNQGNSIVIGRGCSSNDNANIPVHVCKCLVSPVICGSTCVYSNCVYTNKLQADTCVYASMVCLTGNICSCTGCIKYPIYEARYSDGNTNYRGFFCWNKLQLGNNGANQIIAGDETGGGRLEFVVNNCADGTAASNGTTAMVMCTGGGVYGCVCLQSPRICGTSCLRGATVCATGQARVCSICTVGDVCNTIAGQLSVNCLCSTTSMTRSLPTWSIMGTRYLPTVNASANLPVGWHTIFVNTGSRAGGRFVLRDTTGSRHQYVVFYATHQYGSGNSINVLSYSRYSGQPIQCVRIKDESTYSGAALQVYVCDATNNLVAYEAGDNIHSSGWYFLNSWCCDACVPYSTSCFNACWPAGCYCTGASVNLHCIQDGGQILTGKLYAPVICGTSCVDTVLLRASCSSLSCACLVVGTGGFVPVIKAGGGNTDLRICSAGTGGWIDFHANGSMRLCISTAGVVCAPGRINSACLHSSGNICGEEICSGSWFRNESSGQGLYNSATGFHFYSTAANNIRIYGANANNIGLQGYACGGGRGCLHFNCHNQIHIYDSGGNARILVNSSNDIRLCNTTCVYGNLDVTSQIKGGRICSTATGSCAIVSAGGICVTSDWYRITGNNGLYFSSHTAGIHGGGTGVVCAYNNGSFCSNATSGWGLRSAGCILAGSCMQANCNVCAGCYVYSPIVCGTSSIQSHSFRSGANNMCLCPSGCGYGIFFGPANNGEKQHWTTSTFTASSAQARRAKLLEFVYNTHHWDSGGPIFIDIYHNYYGKGSHQRWQVIQTGLDGTGSQNCTAGADLPAGARDAALVLMESNGPDANNFKLHLDMHAAGYKVSDYDVGIAEVYLDVDYYAQVVAKVTMHGTWSNINTGASFAGTNQYKFYNTPTYTNISTFHNSPPTVPSTGGRILFADRIYGKAYWQAGCENCYTNVCTRYLDFHGTSCLTNLNTQSTICGSGLICANSCLRTPYVFATNCVYTCCGIDFVHSNWTGEKTKIQAHSTHLYFQNYNTGCFFFRNCHGGNIASINCAGCLCVNNCIRAVSNICSQAGITGSSYVRSPGYLQVSTIVYPWSTSQNCVRYATGNNAGTGWLCPLLLCRCGGVVINGGTNSTSNDAALFICQTNNNDWALKVSNNTGTATEYGIKVDMGASATYGYDAVFGGVRKFTVSYHRVCHSGCMLSPVVCGSSYMNSGKFCSGGSYLCSNCLHVAGAVCSTTGFYGDGSNLTGISAGGSLCGSTGSANGSCTTLGYCALPSGTGTGNVAIGFKAMQATTSGFANTASGYRVMCCNTTGNNNTAFGQQALFKNTTGFRNTAIGVSALYNNNAASNTAVGGCAMQQTTTGSQNTAVGVGALYATTSASSNTSSGYQSAYATTTGQRNTSMGAKSLRVNTTGGQNVALGYYAMYSNTGGSDNVAVGCGALYGNTTGGNNIGIGKHAGCANTTACNRTYIGNASTTNTYICGALSKSSGCFNIPHPDPAKREKYDLVHSFVESPTEGDNIYRWTTETTNCRSVIELPDYYRYLNKNDQVWISPNRHFGNAYGEVTEDQKCLIVCSETDGNYNVLLIGTRKDAAVQSWEGPEVLAEKKYKE